MMKNTTLTLLVAFVGWLGLIFALIMFYASPDGVVRTTHGGVFFLASCVFVFSFLYNLDLETSKILKWINILLGVYYMMCGVILSLICLYAHPFSVEGTIDATAAVLFFVGSMLVGSGLFFMIKQMRACKD